MTALTTLVASAAAAALLWAGLEKARDRGPATATLRALGVPPGAAAPAAASLALAEVAVGLALIFRPDSAWAQAGVVALALAFATAGLLALRRREPVRCRCFGAEGGGYLGWSQVVALVPWLGLAAVLRLGGQGAEPLSAGAGRFALVGLALAGIRAAVVWRARDEARGDRRTAREMYVWLR